VSEVDLKEREDPRTHLEVNQSGPRKATAWMAQKMSDLNLQLLRFARGQLGLHALGSKSGPARGLDDARLPAKFNRIRI
jgi:hypothetical protein